MVAAILAIIQAVPAVRDIFFLVVDEFHKAQVAAYENQSIKVQKEREATVAAMKSVNITDEQRAVLRRRLWELRKL